MAITLTVGTPQDIDSAAAHTQSFDAGAGAKAIVVALASSNHFDNNGPVTYGGKTLTKWAEGSWSTGGHNRGEIWGYEGSDIPSGSNTLTVTTTSATAARSFVPYGVAASGVLSKSVQGDSNSASYIRHTYDAGALSGRIIIAGSVKSNTPGTPMAAISGTTADYVRYDGTDAEEGIGHETADGTGVRTVGFNKTWLVGRASVEFTEDEINFTPDPFGMEMGFNAGALTVSADVTIPAARWRGLEMGFNAGQLLALSKRQVMLTGEDLDTVEMTEDGDEGDVLTQHAGRPPTWEAGGGGSSGRWVPMTINALAPGPIPSDIVEIDTARSTTSAALEDISGATFDLVLPRPARIEVNMAFSCLTISGGGSPSVIAFAINVDGTDHQELQRSLSGTGDRGIGAVVHLTEVLPAGTYTVKGRFRRVSGASTPGIDALSLVGIVTPADDDWQLLFTDGGDVVMMFVPD